MLARKNIFYVLVLCLSVASQAYATDRRAYQHGVRLIKDHEASVWVIWSSSSGNPPEGEKKVILPDGGKCSYFTHDIFYSSIDPAHPIIEPRLLLAMPEAQEPVDVAVSELGTIIITFEDGSDSNLGNCDGIIEQRYKIYNAFPGEGKDLRTVQVRGAHSGHVSAVGENFVIAYAEGWIDEDGAFDAGTANDIHVETIDQEGNIQHHLAVAQDKGLLRDWWPLVSGSSKSALLVWQRLVRNSNYAQLMVALYDYRNNKLLKPVTVLKENLQYYHYDVQYLPTIKRFLVVGNFLGTTAAANTIPVVTPTLFAVLLDESTNIVNTWQSDSLCIECSSYPVLNLVREARPAVLNKDTVAEVLYPIKPDGVAWFEITPRSISLKRVLRQPQLWFPLGTDGTFVDDNQALFVNLTQTGIKVINVSNLASE